MNRVEGKVAVVSGAGSGLGEAGAKLLAQNGASVVVTDINPDWAAKVARKIGDEGGSAIAMALDVRSSENWKRCFDEVIDRFGKVNVLVNNAGVVYGGDVEHGDLEEWRDILSVNLDGVFLGTQIGIREMRKNGELCSIINMSSIEGMVGHPLVAAYNASKGGVRAFTKSAALYCAQQGLPIRVNSVHPGGISTPMLEMGFESVGSDHREKFIAEHPIGRLGEPLDIAYGVLYLASDESKFVLGTELVIDGGYLAR